MGELNDSLGLTGSDNGTHNHTLRAECLGTLFCLGLHVKLIFGAILLSIVSIGFLGNLFVISVILPNRKMLKASINVLLLNLAVADLGNLITSSVDAFQAVNDQGWLLADVLCPVMRYLMEYCLYASLLLQVAICIERYLAICAPFRLTRLSRQSILWVAPVIWVLAGAFASPYLASQRTVELRWPFTGLRACLWSRATTSRSLQRLFKYAECLVLYFLPLVLLSLLYAKTCYVLWGKDTQRLHGSSRQAQAVLKLRRSVIKMLVICMLVYFLCYSPIQGLFIMATLFGRHFSFGQELRLALNALAMASSAANPIVYTVCCQQFRLRLLAIFNRGNSARYRLQHMRSTTILLTERQNTRLTAQSLLNLGSRVDLSSAVDSDCLRRSPGTHKNNHDIPLTQQPSKRQRHAAIRRAPVDRTIV